MCFVIILKNSTYRILVRENPLKYMKSDMKNSQNLLENQLRHGWAGASFFNNTTCVLPDVPGVCICFFSWRRLPKHSGWTWMCSLHSILKNLIRSHGLTQQLSSHVRVREGLHLFTYYLFTYYLFTVLCSWQVLPALAGSVHLPIPSKQAKQHASPVLVHASPFPAIARKGSPFSMQLG